MDLRRAVSAVAVASVLAVLPAPAAGAPALVDVGEFNAPMNIGGMPGRDGDIVVVERDGRMVLVEDDVAADDPFADLSARVDTEGERGLMSVAFDPDYEDTGLLYVFFAAKAAAGYDLGDLVVEELRRDPTDPDRVDPAYRRTVLRLAHPDPRHYGGQLAFAADELLFVSVGDGGGVNDPEEDAQDLTNLHGKLLRVDPAAGSGCDGGCTIPAGNPFSDVPGARPEIWAYGLRNPWRFSIDRLTGDIAIADVGQDDVEEINVLWAANGGGAGSNFGWPCTEGSLDNDGSSCAVPADHVPPVIERAHPEWRSITGGVVVRDPEVPSLAGRFLYTDFFSDVLVAATLGSDAGVATDLTTERVSSIAQDDDGHVYVTSLFGPVRRLVEPTDDSAETPIAAVPVPDGPVAEQPRAGGAITPPIVGAFYGRRQRALRTRRIRLAIRCSVACRVRVRGRAGPHGRALPARTLLLPPDARRRTTIVLSRRLARRLRRDRRRTGKPVVARLTLRATGDAGTIRTRTLTIRLKR